MRGLENRLNTTPFLECIVSDQYSRIVGTVGVIAEQNNIDISGTNNKVSFYLIYILQYCASSCVAIDRRIYAVTKTINSLTVS